MEHVNQMPLVSKNSDVMMAVGVVCILSVMLMPLPAFMLDLLLTFNITLSLVVLLVGMYILKPLDLSSFPSILLLMTLFRLSLNIASTRIILIHGNEGTDAAGQVIHAFGNFVVGGNYVVGIIVFTILVVINFIVITKGAGRIAEVAARFTLDAMPGKQMAIDADLNAGLINEEEAKQRRREVAQEAEYYGSMDGANKFVRGDAVAGIIITIINIVAGLTIGVLQNDMSFGEAAETYTLLTVGDGLVSQIPALIISTAAGIIVSRAGSDISLGRAITSQVLIQPRAIAVASAVLFGFALVPGMPGIPFLLLSLIAGGGAYYLVKMRKAEERRQEAAAVVEEESKPPEMLSSLPPLDILSLEVGYGLIPLVDMEQDGELLERIKTIRRQMANDIGIIVSPIHIQDNMQLKPGEYAILLKGNEIARGDLMLNYFLAMDPGSVESHVEGIPTREPTYGLPALWIKADAREAAISKGYTVVDLPTILTTHLSEVIRRNAYELLGRQEVQQLLDDLKGTHPKVVEELVPNLLSLGGVVKVLQNLLKEQVSVRDLLTILEALADWAAVTKDPDILTEYARQALSRSIFKPYLALDGSLPLVTLDQKVETEIAGAIQQTDLGSFLAIEPHKAQTIANSLGQSLERFQQMNLSPVVVCSSQIRPHFKKLMDRFIPQLTVLSYDEILPDVRIQNMGTVELTYAD